MSEAATRVTLIQPRRGWIGLGLGEVWEFRDLLWVFAARDIKVRYKQTVLGAAWAVLQPFSVMVIFSIFFGRLAKIPSDGIPYPVFAFAALVPWYYFSHCLAAASGSIVQNQSIITKVYFPRIILLLAPLVSGLVDFGIGLVVLVGMALCFGIVPTVAVVYLPALVLFAAMTALAGGLWLSGLNAHYRDFRYVVPFFLQIGFFSTPIAYPSSLIKNETYRALYGLNPMAGVVEGFRWALLGKGQPPGAMLLVSAGVVFILLVTGLAFFRRMERTFVDVV